MYLSSTTLCLIVASKVLNNAYLHLVCVCFTKICIPSWKPDTTLTFLPAHSLKIWQQKKWREIQCAVMWWDCAAAYNGDPADSSAEAFLPIAISWKGFWCLLIKSLIVSPPPITKIYPFYRDLGTKQWNSHARIVCWVQYVLITRSCFMIIPLSNGLLLNICLWLAFDSDELFIVQPPTPTTAPTLKSIVPLKPACLLLIWVIATSSRKGFGPIIHIL